MDVPTRQEIKNIHKTVEASQVQVMKVDECLCSDATMRVLEFRDQVVGVTVSTYADQKNQFRDQWRCFRCDSSIQWRSTIP